MRLSHGLGLIDIVRRDVSALARAERTLQKIACLN